MTNDEKKELLCALVDGKTLQFKNIDDKWVDCYEHPPEVAIDILRGEKIRIKPESIARTFRVCPVGYGGINVDIDVPPNLKLTWEGDNLISAEVLK